MIFYGGRIERGRMCKCALDAWVNDIKPSVGQMIFKGLRFKHFLGFGIGYWADRLDRCIKSSAAEGRVG